jgi:hypothetical protein
MPLNWWAPSTGLIHFSRLIVYISTSGFRSSKIRISSKIPARTTATPSSSPSELTLPPNSGVPIVHMRYHFHQINSRVQTTVGTEIIFDIISTIRCFWYFFWTSRDLHFCNFNNETIGERCPGKFATVDAVAQSLGENKMRLCSQPTRIRDTCRCYGLPIVFNSNLATETAANRHLCRLTICCRSDSPLSHISRRLHFALYWRMTKHSAPTI